MVKFFFNNLKYFIIIFFPWVAFARGSAHVYVAYRGKKQFMFFLKSGLAVKATQNYFFFNLAP